MEGKFETSFIPKKNPVQAAVPARTPHTTSFFSVIAGVILITTLVLAGGLFGYSSYLKSHNESLKAELEKELAKFEPSLVAELSRMDVRIESTKDLLDKHLALSSFFNVLASGTLKTVRFTNFKYTLTNGKVVVSMNGQAQSFTAVALQSAEFLKPQYASVIKTPQFTNLNLDKSGNVLFDFSATLDAKKISYKNFINGMVAQDSGPEVETATTTASTTKQTN